MSGKRPSVPGMLSASPPKKKLRETCSPLKGKDKAASHDELLEVLTGFEEELTCPMCVSCPP
jgi:hypothetical protein